MPLVNIVIALIVVGMALWLINRFIPMASSIKSILKCNLDSQAIEPVAEPKPPLDHPNIRGSEYFDTGEEPTIE